MAARIMSMSIVLFAAGCSLSGSATNDSGRNEVITSHQDLTDQQGRGDSLPMPIDTASDSTAGETTSDLLDAQAIEVTVDLSSDLSSDLPNDLAADMLVDTAAADTAPAPCHEFGTVFDSVISDYGCCEGLSARPHCDPTTLDCMACLTVLQICIEPEDGVCGEFENYCNDSGCE